MPRTRRICYCPAHEGPRNYAAKTWLNHRRACHLNGTDFEYWKRAANQDELRDSGPSNDPMPYGHTRDSAEDNITEEHELDDADHAAARPAHFADAGIGARSRHQQRARQTPRRVTVVSRAAPHDTDTEHGSGIENEIPPYRARSSRRRERPRIHVSNSEMISDSNDVPSSMDLDEVDPDHNSEYPYDSSTVQEEEDEVGEPSAEDPSSDPGSEPEAGVDEDDQLGEMLREFFDTISVEDLADGAGM